VTPEVHSPWRWLLKARLLRLLGMKIGDGVAIDKGFEWLESSKLTLQDNAVIGRNVKIYNFSEVSIGKFSMFASEILIANGGHNKENLEPFSGPLTIGHGCWIGAGVKIIGANLHVGNNAIIGAGSLVISDIPANAIAVGVPARVIGYRNLPDKVWHLGNTWFSPYTFEFLEGL
jgi:acetyltransferase-like isoleucine patch superfamily enzyme